MSGGKGGSQTTQVEIPAWLENAAQQNLAKAGELSQIGYTPYYGPDVAAMTPMQEAAGQNINTAAGAFGLAGASPMAGMPQATTYDNGVRGYSSGSLYDQALGELQSRMPGQYAALQAPFINPVTGAAPASPFGSYTPATAAPVAAPYEPAQSGGRDEFYNQPDGSYFDRASATNTYDPYLDPTVVGTGTALKNTAKSVSENVGSSMGAGK